MPAIIKNELRIANSDAFRYSILNNPTYVFISQTSAWQDDFSPPSPIDSINDENTTLSELVGLKRIAQSDIVSVIPRTNWSENKIYDQYDHEVDLINTRNPDTGDFWRFYVLTSDFNIYKCLSNNYGAQSTTRPIGTTPEPFQTPDGYIWKYMYTIQTIDAFKFMTTNWMPCYTLISNDNSPLWPSQQSAIPGTIDNIIVTSKGTGYDPIDPPTINIVGDGTNATAIPSINPISGEIDHITVTNSGLGYTNVSITIAGGSVSGSGALARAIVSPRSGHGSDPRVELGATYLMVKVTLQGDEDGKIPANVEYRSNGIIMNPAGNTQSTVISIDVDDCRLFTVNETITGQTSGASGTLIHIDYMKGLLYVNNVVGTFSQSETITSQSYNVAAIKTNYIADTPLTAMVYGSADINKSTGKILFQSNREKITRIQDQKEEIVSVISF